MHFKKQIKREDTYISYEIQGKKLLKLVVAWRGNSPPFMDRIAINCLYFDPSREKMSLVKQEFDAIKNFFPKKNLKINIQII